MVSGLRLEELHRFSNRCCQSCVALFTGISCVYGRRFRPGIEKGKDHNPAGIGVDTWGVDFALLDRDGDLLANPVCYRDGRTEGMMESVFAKVPKAEVFERTGIQFMRINTLYQMMSLVEANRLCWTRPVHYSWPLT